MADARIESLRTDETRSLSDGLLAARLVNSMGGEFAKQPYDVGCPQMDIVELMLGSVDSVHTVPRSGEYHVDAQPFMAEVLARITERHTGERADG